MPEWTKEERERAFRQVDALLDCQEIVTFEHHGYNPRIIDLQCERNYFEAEIASLRSQLAGAEHRWISVNERLPETLNAVWVWAKYPSFTATGSVPTEREHEAWYDERGWHSFEPSATRWVITHWMPRPPAPLIPQASEVEK